MRRYLKKTAIWLAAAAVLILALAFTLAACNKTAKETPITVTIYANNGTSAHEDYTLLRSELSSWECPYVYKGYHATGLSLYEDGEPPISENSVISDGSKLYVIWEINVYTVRFVVGSGDSAKDLCDPQQVEHGGEATPPEFNDFWMKIPKMNKFVGWKSGNDTWESDAAIESDMTIQADLQEAGGCASFVANGETLFRYSGDPNEQLPPPPVDPPAKAGHTFAGWKKGTGGAVYAEGTTTVGDYESTYYPIYNADAPAPPVITDTGLGGTSGTDFSVLYTGTLRLKGAASAVAPNGITYSVAWYRIGTGEDGADELKSSGENYDISGLEVGDYQFRCELTAMAENNSTAMASTSFTVHVTKLPANCSLNIDDSVRLRDWTGEPLAFSASATVTTQAYKDAPQFEFLLDGEPVNGASFSITDGGTYTLTAVLKESAHYKEARDSKTIKIRCVSTYLKDATGNIKSQMKRTLEDALAVDPTKVSGYATGDTFIILPLCDTHLIKGDYTLNALSRLVLPYDGSDDDAHITGHLEVTSTIFYIDISDEQNNLRRKLTLKDGANLTVNGAVVVGGISSSKDTFTFQGATQGEYAQIDILEGACITVAAGGTLQNHGYIKGDGQLIALDGGTIYTPFVVRDFRGGSNTAQVYTTYEICPFNQYEMPNIQVYQTLKYGAKVFVYCSIYAGEQHNDTEVLIVGKTGALLNLQNGELKVKVSSEYNAGITLSNNKMELADKYKTSTKLDILGDVAVGKLSLKVSFSGFEQLVTTGAIDFAVPHMYDITLNTGYSLKLGMRYKLLPGAKLTVEKGADFYIGLYQNMAYGSLAVYDGSWQDESVVYNHPVYPHNKGEAKLIVNGTLHIENGAYFGGKITSEVAGATVIVSPKTTLTITIKEGSASTFPLLSQNDPNDKVTDIVCNATIGDADMQTDKTYTFNGSAWA